FRAVAQNQYGTSYGTILSFRTTSTTVVTVPTRVIVQPSRSSITTVVAKSAPSLLELRVDSTYDHMCVNGSIDYTVTYHNISSQVLKAAVMQVTNQKEVT